MSFFAAITRSGDIGGGRPAVASGVAATVKQIGYP
jgi:hypothetical protein